MRSVQTVPVSRCVARRCGEGMASIAGLARLWRPVGRLPVDGGLVPLVADSGLPVTGDVMKNALKNLVSKFVADEQGGEVLEYALIAGLIVVAAIASISAV